MNLFLTRRSLSMVVHEIKPTKVVTPDSTPKGPKHSENNLMKAYKHFTLILLFNCYSPFLTGLDMVIFSRTVQLPIPRLP